MKSGMICVILLFLILSITTCIRAIAVIESCKMVKLCEEEIKKCRRETLVATRNKKVENRFGRYTKAKDNYIQAVKERKSSWIMLLSYLSLAIIFGIVIIYNV